MGIVYSLYRRGPKQRYDLGKARRGYPSDITPPNLIQSMNILMSEYRKQRGDVSAFMKFHSAMTKLSDPGHSAMWEIMGGDGNYRIFRMSDWNRDDLANVLYRASANIDNIDQALIVADNIIEWAGDAEVTLNAEEPEALRKLGWSPRGYRDTGSIYEALDNAS